MNLNRQSDQGGGSAPALVVAMQVTIHSPNCTMMLLPVAHPVTSNEMNFINGWACLYGVQGKTTGP